MDYKKTDSDYYEKAKTLKEGDVMVTIDGIYPDSEETIHNKYFYRDKRGHLYKIVDNK